MSEKRSHVTLTNIFLFLSRRFSLLSGRSRGLMENLGLRRDNPNRQEYDPHARMIEVGDSVIKIHGAEFIDLSWNCHDVKD